MICTFYSHSIGIERALKLIQSKYPTSSMSVDQRDGSHTIEIEIKGGLFRGASALTIAYRERLVPSYQFVENDACPLLANLKGLYGYVSSLPACDEKVQGQLLGKILTVNTEFSILQKRGETKDLKGLLQAIAKAYKAVLFVQPNTVISKSAGQHFLDERLNLLLDVYGNSSVRDLQVEIDSIYFDADQETLTNDQETRKLLNEVVLSNHNVYVTKHLPVIVSEQDVMLRSPLEIAQRTAILAMTNLVAFDHVPSDMAKEYFQKFDLWEFVTPKEREFLANPTEAAKAHETWKCECIWTLMWALGHVDELGFPNELCNLEAIPPEHYPMKPGTNPNDFIDSEHHLRSKSEILDAADLYYRMDWSCVDARIKNVQLTEVHPSVVYERHYALNWLIHYRNQDWDNVSCDT